MIELLHLFFTIYVVLVLHEAGHLATAYCLGRPISRVRVGNGPLLASFFWRGMRFDFRLVPFSGEVLICWPSRRAWKDIAVIASGPVANMIAAAALGLTGFSEIAFISFWVGVNNLMPFKGSDGSQILRKLRA